MLIQPKPYRDKLRLRNQTEGIERRKNMSRLILEHGTPLPKPIEYSDIDEAMYNWVKDKINIDYDGKRLPTYKLYSTQRLSEYIQQWQDQDETGNPNMNFKAVTRENNPQKGESQGNYFNIPGHKDFAMFYIPILQENGTEAYDKYTIKQPFQVNFIYSVSIVSNKMEVINKMNELMHYEFSAIDCYISPNDHPMSMTLEDVLDNSEYSIDDRKYYSQTYKVKVRGYIIRKEDYKVERIPSRILMPWRDSDASGIVSKRGKNRRNEDKVTFMTVSQEERQAFNLNALKEDNENCPIPIMDTPNERPSDIYEPNDDNDICYDDDKGRYYKKVIKIIIDFSCVQEVTFEMDKDFVLESVEIDNVYDFKLLVNGELMSIDNDVKFINGDEITVRISREIIENASELVLVGYDPNEVVDSSIVGEVSIDEPIGEEHILVNPNDEN